MSSCRAVALPFLQQWLKHSQILWNLWMTLETGQRSLKMDVNPPTVIVSCPSHPFSLLTRCSLTEATWQPVAGNAHITEVSMVRNHTKLWEILGREVLRAANGQKHLPAVKPIKMNDDSLFISLSFSGYSAQSVFISRSSHHRRHDFSVCSLSQLLIKSATV